MSYNAAVHREQGGSVLVVASSTASDSATHGLALFPVQSLGSSQTATTIYMGGLTVLTATTTGPTYTLPAPSRAGILKGIAISAATSAASNVVVAGETTGVQIGVTGDNQVTITSTGAGAGVLLWSNSTTSWACVGGGTQVTAAQST